MKSSIHAGMSKGILVLGSLNMDLVIETDRLPNPGETIEGKRFYSAPGGKGANQAVAAARFAEQERTPVKMIGRVGSDSFGNDLRASLKREGIDDDDVTVDEHTATGVAAIFIDASGENYISAVYGANGRCGETELNAVEQDLEASGVLLVQQEIAPAVSFAAMQMARERGVKVILEPDPARRLKEMPANFYSQSDILTPNAIEAEVLSGISVHDSDSAERAADAIRNRFGNETVIVTMAGSGAYVASEDMRVYLPAFNVRTVSSVAAGDAFNGTLGVALIEEYELGNSIELAMAAGALAVCKAGAQESMPERKDVIELAERKKLKPRS